MRIRAILVSVLVLVAGGRAGGADEPGCQSLHWYQYHLNISEPGDHIYVSEGTYCGGLFVAVDNVSVTAAGHVVFVPAAEGPVHDVGFEVFADGVTISGFELRGFDIGFSLGRDRSGIYGNTVRDSRVGFITGTSGHRIVGNSISNSKDRAIWLWGVEGVDVSYNTIAGGVVGIELAGAYYPTATPNQIHHNGVTGAGTGIFGWDCAASLIFSNVVSDSTVGILASSCGGAAVKANLARRNENGIVIADCAGTIVGNNTARENEQAGITVSSCDDAVVVHNLAQRNGHGIAVDRCVGCSIGFNSVSFNGLGEVPGHGIELSNVDRSRVERNNVSRSNPPDCVWDGLGTNVFWRNSCVTEAPTGAWD